jgi:hypothetical protein
LPKFCERNQFVMFNTCYCKVGMKSGEVVI